MLKSSLLSIDHTHVIFHCVITCSFYKYPNELSLQHCWVVFCILFEPVAYFDLFLTQYTQGLSLVLLMWYFIQFALIVCSCATHNNASVPTFISPHDSHCHVFSFSTFSRRFHGALSVHSFLTPLFFQFFRFLFLKFYTRYSLSLSNCLSYRYLIRFCSELATQNP